MISIEIGLKQWDIRPMMNVIFHLRLYHSVELCFLGFASHVPSIQILSIKWLSSNVIQMNQCAKTSWRLHSIVGEIGKGGEEGGREERDNYLWFQMLFSDRWREPLITLVVMCALPRSWTILILGVQTLGFLSQPSRIGLGFQELQSDKVIFPNFGFHELMNTAWDLRYFRSSPAMDESEVLDSSDTTKTEKWT